MSKKKSSKFLKNFNEELKNMKFTKHHFYYTVLVLIIIILSLFLFNNYNKCSVYELSGSSENFALKNGTLVMTSDDNILKVNNIAYTGEDENASTITIELYVDVDGEKYTLNSFSSASEEGFIINDTLDRVYFDLNETKNNINVFTKTVRNNIVDNLKLSISMINMDGETEEETINVKVDNLYRNDRLVY